MLYALTGLPASLFGMDLVFLAEEGSHPPAAGDDGRVPTWVALHRKTFDGPLSNLEGTTPSIRGDEAADLLFYGLVRGRAAMLRLFDGRRLVPSSWPDLVGGSIRPSNRNERHHDGDGIRSTRHARFAAAGCVPHCFASKSQACSEVVTKSLEFTL